MRVIFRDNKLAVISVGFSRSCRNETSLKIKLVPSALWSVRQNKGVIKFEWDLLGSHRLGHQWRCLRLSAQYWFHWISHQCSDSYWTLWPWSQVIEPTVWPLPSPCHHLFIWYRLERFDIDLFNQLQLSCRGRDIAKNHLDIASPSLWAEEA